LPVRVDDVRSATGIAGNARAVRPDRCGHPLRVPESCALVGVEELIVRVDQGEVDAVLSVHYHGSPGDEGPVNHRLQAPSAVGPRGVAVIGPVRVQYVHVAPGVEDHGMDVLTFSIDGLYDPPAPRSLCIFQPGADVGDVHPARTVHGDARVPAHVAGAVHDLVRPQARGVRRVVQVPVRTVSEAEVRSALPVDGEAAVHAGPVRPFERLRGHGPASIVGVVYVGPVAEAQMHVVLGVDCHGRVPPRGPIGDALHR